MEPLIDERPSKSCSTVPRSACAIAYDSHDCTGGWKLVVPQGQLRFRWFTSYWSYRFISKQKEEFKDDENFCRNDMDTVGIRAGCTLILYSDSSFNGDSVRIDSYATNDRYLIVLRHRSFM